jgi:hypothetical protein
MRPLSSHTFAANATFIAVLALLITAGGKR